MGRKDVEKALHAMDDEGVRNQLAGGDFAAVPGLDLTAEEQAMVKDAAGDYPDVAGFAFNAFVKLSPIAQGEALKYEDKWVKIDTALKFKIATEYALGDGSV
jgi:hypothetical protein